MTAAWALVGLGLGGCGVDSGPPQSRAAAEAPAPAALAEREPAAALPAPSEPSPPSAPRAESLPAAASEASAPSVSLPPGLPDGPAAPPAAPIAATPGMTPAGSAPSSPPAPAAPPRALTPAELARVLPKTFDDIKLDLEKDEPFDRSKLTPAVEALFGRRIRIRGFIHPNVPFNSGITRFVLVRDNMECCFGPGAALHDCIFVEMVPGQSIDFTTRPITIEGRFSFRELLDPIDGRVLAIYHLEGEALR